MSDPADKRRRFMQTLDGLSITQAKYVAQKLFDEVSRLNTSQREPIAIVGIGCRFPGGNNSPDEYWRSLLQARDCVDTWVDRRFPAGAFSHEANQGRIASQRAGLIDDVDGFDNAAFGIAPRELEWMDPQHRVLLETAWHALEHAGYGAHSMHGSRTGVFVGIATHDYEQLQTRNFDWHEVDAQSGTGLAPSVAAGRIAYCFGLQGPTLAVDTACSSSLVAVHLAIQSLRRGECDAALAGGVNLLLYPFNSCIFTAAGMLSRNGICRTFDDDADGYVRSEGCGLVMLKRLSDAMRDRDAIVAVIRGSAINHDGRSQGLTAPNATAQEQVLRAALTDADCSPDAVHHCEAHGTGTSLGDPIELNALGGVYGRQRRSPLLVSSIKAQFGHMEAAAGIGGLIKQALAIERGVIPSHLYLNKMNRHVDARSLAISVPAEAQAWPTTSVRRGAVSSFGFSGTNSHVILEQAPVADTATKPAAAVAVLKVSARSVPALSKLAETYREALAQLCDTDVDDFCFSVNTGRSDYEYRQALHGDRETLLGSLANLSASAARIGEHSRAKAPSIEFSFDGNSADQGSIAEQLRSLLGDVDCLTELALPQADIAAAASFAQQTSPIPSDEQNRGLELLACVIAANRLMRWGVEPSAVRGTGLGEFAAACIAGAIDLEDALHLLTACSKQDDSFELAVQRLAPKRATRILRSTANADFSDTQLLGLSYWRAVRRSLATVATAPARTGAAICLTVRGTVAVREQQQPAMTIGLAQLLNPERSSALLAALYSAGVAIDWQGYYADRRLNRLRIPAYPFQRTSFWLPGLRPGELERRGRSARARVLIEQWMPVSVDSREPIHERVLLICLHPEGARAAIPECLAALADIVLEPGTTVSDDQLRHEIERDAGNTPGLHAIVWAPALPADSGDVLVADLETRCAALLTVAKTLARRNERARLSIVTSDAWKVEVGDIPSCTTAAIAAMARVIGNELADFRCAHVDLGSRDSCPMTTARLRALLSGESAQIAVRGHVCFRRAWASHSITALSPAPIRSDRCYVVTGGLGGIGGHVVRWLAGKGAKRVICLSRSAHEQERAALEAELASHGASLLVETVDVREYEAVASAVVRLAGEYALGGVIHLAGVLNDATVLTQTRDRLVAACEPKARGALNLLRLTASLRADFCVLFSSLTAALGTPGQSAYAAANAFLDAFALANSGASPALLSIGWGPWQATGMARRRWSGETTDSLHGAATTQALDPSEALECLANLLGQRGHVLVATESLAANLTTSLPSVQRTASVQSTASDQHLGDATLDHEPQRRRERVTQELRRLIGTTLKLTVQEQNFPGDQPLRELGLDSMMAVEVRNRIVQATGRDYPIALLYEHPTVDELARCILESARESVAPGASVVAPAHVAAGDIAIIGMACRFPGRANSPEEFWEMLTQGRSGIEPLTNLRWSEDEYYSPERDAKGKMYVNRGGLVHGIHQFDYALFGISRKEAEVMDPHQKLLLELSWEAFERAGYRPRSLRGTATGFFIGMMASDFSHLITENCDPRDANPYMATGSSMSVAAGRLAYFYGTQGPCIVLDTACSSSLVAVHQACQSLRTGESDLAVAGGVNLILAPGGNIMLCSAQMLAPDGECKAFDASADGYVRSEGCGLIVLKPLSAALTDGDRIHAVIKGSAINQAGRTQGLTAPNGVSQEQVIKRALQVSNTQPTQVDYVEAHGTGTALGDPIEIDALRRAYCTPRNQNDALYVGAVKTNIGHCESAAGIAGLIKAVLAVEHGIIPPNLNLRRINPHLQVDACSSLRFPTSAQPWRREIRYAGVSSFGFSGSNSHCIVQSHPSVEPTTELDLPGLHLCKVSSETIGGLKRLANRYAEYFSRLADSQTPSTCFTINRHRGDYKFRVLAWGRTREELIASLRSIDARAITETGRAPRTGVALLFRAGASEPVNAKMTLRVPCTSLQQLLDAEDSVFTDVFGRSLAVTLSGMNDAGPARLGATVITQACVAALLAKLGLVAQSIAADTLGSYAAAIASGAIDTRNALQLLELATQGEAAHAAFVKRVEAIRWRAETAPTASVMDDGPTLSQWARLGGRLASDHNTRESPLAVQIAADGTLSIDAERSGAQRAAPRDFASSLVHALAHAYAAGLSIDWSVLYPRGKRSDAPTYSFEPSECGELLFYSRSSRPGSDSGARQSASLYREAWKPCSRVGASSHERRASLFFAQNADGALESLPPDAHAIVCGKQLRQIGPHLWEAPVECPQHLIDIVAALDMERSGVDLVLVAPSVSPLEAAEFHRRNSRAMSLAILLAQFAIGRAMNGIATRLHLISQRGRAVRQRESEEPTLAGLCALMQVLRLEYPLAAGHTIDLDCSDDSLPACAHRELQAPHDCDEYALRDGRVFERRIEPVTLPPYPASLSIHADRTYLITGGTGGLGLQTAAALVQRGARHLLLVSRSGRPSTSRETQHLRTLRDAGVSIDIRAADVTDEAALEQIVTDLESGPYKLAGIVHAAGTNQIGRLLDLNSNDALSLIAPKVVGLHHLLRLTQSMPLDFICCYSSIAASWGSGGMAAYSAANRTMNALAAAARTAGRKVSVICWGPWRDSGMAASSVDLARDTGLMPISDSEGIRLFKQLLSGDSGEWIVARLDIDRFSDLYLMKARTRLFTLLRSQITCDAADPSNEVMGEHPLMAVVENDRAYVLQDHLLQLVRDTLNLEADDDVSIDHSLHDLGITSLQALEIRNALNLYTGLKLPGTLLFEYPTVREIARFILASLQPQALENA